MKTIDMEEKLFFSEDSLLFVGEGNYSFSLSFANLKYRIKSITASCFESDVKSEATLQNMNNLKNRGQYPKIIMIISKGKNTEYGARSRSIVQ